MRMLISVSSSQFYVLCILINPSPREKKNNYINAIGFKYILTLLKKHMYKPCINT